MLNERISSARDYLDQSDVEALIFLGLPNIRYLSGFTGSDGMLVLTREKVWLLTDSRYTTQASQETAGLEIVEYKVKKDGLAALLASVSIKKVGFEAEHATFSFFQALCEALSGVDLLPIGVELDDLRLMKDESELLLLEKCAAIASKALLGIMEMIRPGVREREIALELEFSMKRGGADEKAFDFIVASGPRGAFPHGKASDKPLERGELVTIDFGAVLCGYHSDETVTFAVGNTDGKQQEIYSIVKDARDMALEALKPGTSLKELDGVARGFIAEKGYSDYFVHGLGHGVGLEVHERPVLSPRSEQKAVEGMVFTIEPGIYIPGWGGVRIEDTVVVTRDGWRMLTGVPKDLIVL
jgi:Xaa-Pro aminopeptidase